MRVRGGDLASAIGASAIEDRRHTSPAPASLRSTTLLALVLIQLGACSQGSPAPDPQLGVAASPRIAGGQAVPKGGGIYKVGTPYQVAGRWYVPREVTHYDRSGIASWYGAAFHGRRTANGEIYDMHALTAGHPTLPMPSYAYVTNLDNGRTVLVRINDRGPYVNDRLIDLSLRSASELGYSRRGLARVRVRYAGRAPLSGSDAAERRHLAAQSWYRGSLDVAQGPASDITTGALADAARAAGSTVAASRQPSGSTALGGPGEEPADAGPFATRAEAERMRHEMGELGAVVLVQMESGSEPSYFVRLGSPAGAAARGRVRLPE